MNDNAAYNRRNFASVADLERRLEVAAQRVHVTALYKNGSQPLAIAQHLGVPENAVRYILNLPT